MFNLLSEAWNSVALFLQGWKTHLAGFAILFVNAYDAIAPSFDLTQIFKDPKMLMIFNVVMAVLVFIFRQMANTSSKITAAATEKTPE